MKIKARSNNPLAKKARKGFRGFPVATVAFYGPDNQRANKLVIGIIQHQGAEPELKRWYSDEADIRSLLEIESEIKAFLKEHNVSFRSQWLMGLSDVRMRRALIILTGNRAHTVRSGEAGIVSLARRLIGIADLSRRPKSRRTTGLLAARRNHEANVRHASERLARISRSRSEL